MGLDPGVAEKRLFQERYAPLTWGIGFVKLPCREAADAFWRWQEDIDRVERYRLRRREIKGGFEDALRNLSPLHERFISKRLFVSTQSSWTAYFDNKWIGGEPGKVGVLSMRERCEAIALRSTPPRTYQHGGKTYRTGGAVDFTLFGRKPEGSEKESDKLVTIHPALLGGRPEWVNEEYGMLRVVGVTFDERKWEFHNVGAYLPFESIDAYGRRRIKDLFTHEMLVDYARHFGIDPFEEAFYRVCADSPAVLVEARIDRLNRRPVVSMTLADVQERLGLWE